MLSVAATRLPSASITEKCEVLPASRPAAAGALGVARQNEMVRRSAAA